MKKLAILFLAFLLVGVGFLVSAEEAAEGISALMIIPWTEFNNDEYKLTRKALENEEINVAVACSKVGKATASTGDKVDVGILLKDVDVAEYDAIIFIGGPGARAYFNNGQAHRIAREATEHGKVLAAICIAPVILANAGVLEGRQATVYPDHKATLKSKGATYVKGSVVVSEGSEGESTIITGSGPEASRRFGRAIVAALKPET